MLSGNGRHRRPKQAPAFLVTAGVASASAALPLLGAGAAHAVGGETWDRVADCESDGDWSADTGNGYYGGLQLPLSMWAEYGGEEFADSPDLASRSQQITVAERVLEDRGPRAAFPTCALSSGLTAEHRAERLAGTDATEVVEEVEQTARDVMGRFEDGEPVAGRTVAPDATDTTDERAAEGDAAESADERAEAGPADSVDDRTEDERGSGGRHRGTPDQAESEREEASGGGRHAAGDRPDAEASTGAGDGAEADGDRAADEPGGDRTGEGSRGGDAAGSDGDDAAADAEGDTDEGYEVRPGDSLSGIAGQLGVDGGWAALYEANSGTVGDNPDHILPGQLLALTPAERAEAEAAAEKAEAEKAGKATGSAKAPAAP
ncbi:transglycosylase family protein [Streptomyces bohaiensis]|uniref:transglycosylase family protein n=1 Tax=Streptomyces bohaiensis TaxID=1431344 RepID=UPI003B7DBFF8